jgi:1-acyl-sn-glycerol-3-phosphate acyltransferase
MTRRDLFLLRLQDASGRIAVFAIAPLIVLLMKLIGYRVNDLEKIRKEIDALFVEHQGPWIICANHLTLIDSVILAYAMFPAHRYMLAYRLLPWNLPEKRNFQRNPIVGLLCYLLKCIPVVRGGDRRSVKSCLDKCARVLERGESVMIFPEGTRSRSGRVNTESFSYGPGRLACCHPACRVMCLYLRGERQESWSSFPARNENFFIAVDTCDFNCEMSGLKAHREYSRQIIEKLAQMEAVCLHAPGQ